MTIGGPTDNLLPDCEVVYSTMDEIGEKPMTIKTGMKKTVLILFALVLASSMLSACTLDRMGTKSGKDPKQPSPPNSKDRDYIRISDFYDTEEAEKMLGEEILVSTVDSINNPWCCGSDFYTKNFVLIIKLYQQALVKPDDTFVGGEGQWHEWIEKMKAELANGGSALYEEAQMTTVEDVGDIAYISVNVQGHNWGYYDIFYDDYWLHIEFQYSGNMPEGAAAITNEFEYFGKTLIERVKEILARG